MIGTIYEITNRDRSIVFIGSTIQPVNERWSNHKHDYKRWLEGKSKNYCSIFRYFKQYGIKSFDIEAIEEYEVKSTDELRQFEQLVIDKTSCVNEVKASTGLARGLDRSSYDKLYYAKYRDKINEKINCECGGKYTRKNRYVHVKTMRHREWESSQ
ncbi:TPA: hypothetical protein N0F65_012917 [Lagenidium giganteum]|uniref:GIY-YIG domain-containing protein n=1 Tax=Lagenidium giganteum TaxID=4803 RepID=A0AAV2YUG9_9STRA|nr:TPA: hypothetical protein N0F65_012899 [Lagenidium giganteum]DAZ97048.1 TPA: hypothetical protein N0F65_012917 [Lagenidium giganteum]